MMRHPNTPDMATVFRQQSWRQSGRRAHRLRTQTRANAGGTAAGLSSDNQGERLATIKMSE